MIVARPWHAVIALTRRTERRIDWLRVAGAAFVIAVAVVVTALGYQFPAWFPDWARDERSDRWNSWLQIAVFGTVATLLLARTVRWTWLGRAIVWVFGGAVCLYLIVVSRFEGWAFFRSLNWLWATRALVGFAGTVYLIALLSGEVAAIRRRAGLRRSVTGIPADRLTPDQILGALVAAKPIIVADERGVMVYVTASVAALIGRPVGEIQGKDLATIVPERHRERHLAGFTRYLRTGESAIMGRVLATDVLRDDGTEVPIHLALSHAKIGDRQFFVGSLWRRDTEIML